MLNTVEKKPTLTPIFTVYPYSNLDEVQQFDSDW